jgi:hypothetical protein
MIIKQNYVRKMVRSRLDLQNVWKNEKYTQHFGWNTRSEEIFSEISCRAEDNIKVSVEEVWFEGVNWTKLS